MTQVDFYKTTGTTETARLNFACRLVEKALNNGKRVYVHCNDETQAADFDKLLWTFKPGSFIAHERFGSEADINSPVLIGYAAEPAAADVLLSLSEDVPLFFSRFERILEIVNDNDSIRQTGRARYGFYRDRGYPLNYHDLKTP